MSKDIESLQKRIAPLEKRANTLEKKFSALEEKAMNYTPRSDAVNRAGIPLEIFSRQALIDNGFDVYGAYPFTLYDAGPRTIERSVDIHAMKDSTYTVPEGNSPRAGDSWPERNHILAEVKQRRNGVEWIFSTLPQSISNISIAGADIPVANTAFEIRHGENTKSGGNPSAIANASAQLNQAYMPFTVGLKNGASIEWPGGSKQYALSKRWDSVYLLLITNAHLKYFTPPADFSGMSETDVLEEEAFKSVPWIVYQEEIPVGLKFHQQAVLSAALSSAEGREGLPEGSTERSVMEKMALLGHQIHVVDHRHLSTFLELVNDPPRLQSISVSVSVDGQPSSAFSIPQ